MNSRKGHDTTKSDTDQPNDVTPTNRLPGTGNPGPSDATISPQPLGTGDRLEGWKEIAVFIGRDVRSAMRWKERGIPVRTVPGGKRSRVSASRKEISQWMSGKLAEPSPEVPVLGPPNSDRSSIPARGTHLSRRTLLGLLATAVPVAGVASFLVVHRKAGPERAVLSGNLLTALDGLGRTAWTYRFAGTPWDDNPQSWQVQVLDFEGRGRPGVLVAQNLISAPGADAAGQGELFYFDSDGKLKWTLPARPDLLDFNGQPFAPAWNYSHVIATPSRAGGHTVWAAVRHNFRWPGCVLRIDAKGGSRVHFANAGNIERLSYLRRSDGDFIVFAGENNAFDRSCAGLIGIDDVPAVSPASALPRYRFANGPHGLARSYMLFPTVELETAVNAPYGEAGQVNCHHGGVVVEVGTAGAILHYELSENFEPQAAIPCGSYPAIHRKFEEQGVLKHSWADCPELKKPLTVRWFEAATGWRDVNVPWLLPTNTA